MASQQKRGCSLVPCLETDCSDLFFVLFWGGGGSCRCALWTPFDGPVDPARARIRTGRLPVPGDAWNWALDSLTEALEASEERGKG